MQVQFLSSALKNNNFHLEVIVFYCLCIIHMTCIDFRNRTQRKMVTILRIEVITTIYLDYFTNISIKNGYDAYGGIINCLTKYNITEILRLQI